MGGKRCRSRCRHWKGDKAIAPANKALRQRLGGSRVINASRVSVSYDTLTDGKLSTKFEKGGQMTAQLYVDPASGERMLKAEGKNFQGFTYSADLKRTGDSASAKKMIPCLVRPDAKGEVKRLKQTPLAIQSHRGEGGDGLHLLNHSIT